MAKLKKNEEPTPMEILEFCITAEWHPSQCLQYLGWPMHLPSHHLMHVHGLCGEYYCVNANLNQFQIIKNWNDPCYLLDIFITSSHLRMTHISSLRICYVLSLPLTSSLSIYISDKQKSKALLTLLMLHTWHLKGRQIEDRKSEGKANTRFRLVVIYVHLSYCNSCVEINHKEFDNLS